MPVRHATRHVCRIAGMKLLNWMPLYLRARDTFFAQQHLAALVDVPLGPCAGGSYFPPFRLISAISPFTSTVVPKGRDKSASRCRI